MGSGTVGSYKRQNGGKGGASSSAPRPVRVPVVDAEPAPQVDNPFDSFQTYERAAWEKLVNALPVEVVSNPACQMVMELLVREMKILRDMQDQLEEEGTTYMRKGVVVPHPLVAAGDTKARTVNKMFSDLRMTPLSNKAQTDAAHTSAQSLPFARDRGKNPFG